VQAVSLEHEYSAFHRHQLRPRLRGSFIWRLGMKNIRIGRIVGAVLAIMVLEAVIGAITCGGVFNWVYDLAPTNVW
jgi:hypothetical protein